MEMFLLFVLFFAVELELVLLKSVGWICICRSLKPAPPLRLFPFSRASGVSVRDGKAWRVRGCVGRRGDDGGMIRGWGRNEAARLIPVRAMFASYKYGGRDIPVLLHIHYQLRVRVF